ncbi:MAG: hypothetical protein SF162_04680 [bacterium]|nr:hypothetical protein [bacterium]
MNSLLHGLLNAGLIQFGQFGSNGAPVPIQFRLDMLPSYPTLLRLAADSLIPLLNPGASHLLCGFDSVGLGTAVSLSTGHPLVYQAHSGGEIDLIGAYDIGHPATLITHVLARHTPIHPLIAHARRVGLDIRQVVTLIDAGHDSLSVPDLQVDGVLHLAAMIDQWVSNGELPAGQAAAVKAWMAG